MRKKVIFVGGPFRGKSAWEVEQNIRRAEALALEVWKLGAVAICPHTNTRFFDKELPDEVFLDGIIEILKRCDAMVLTEDWERSTGARNEVRECGLNNIPVFVGRKELARWLKEIRYCDLVDESQKRTGACPWLEPGTGKPLC